jgi:uncharacterized protein (TIGR04255 family)
VEAVLDIDCDLPPGFELAALEGRALEQFKDTYPKFRAQFLQEHRIEATADVPPKISSRKALRALQFLNEDEKQLVQVRTRGFSFNRLAPYTSLDDYLPEIERTWRIYVGLVSPVQIRTVRLRYINRILVPVAAKKVDLDEYLKISPRFPEEEKFGLANFLIQQTAVENDTGHEVNLVLTVQQMENETLPLILDITVASKVNAEAMEWPAIQPIVGSLRGLKNRMFMNTLTAKCIELFQS